MPKTRKGRNLRPPEKKLTILRRAERADKILTSLADDGFRRKDIAKALRTTPEKVSAMRRQVKHGKPDRKTVERLAKAQDRLKAKHKAELPARRAKQEIKRTGINYTDVANSLGLDPQDANKLLKRIRSGKVEPGDLRKVQRSLKDFKLTNVYSLHDETFGDMAVFPNRSQAKKDGRAKSMVKEFSDVRMAFEWWKKIGQGAKYFIAVANEAKGEFQLWDTRTARQRQSRKR